MKINEYIQVRSNENYILKYKMSEDTQHCLKTMKMKTV